MKNFICHASSYLLPILLFLSVADVDFHIGHPFFDEQWYILILLVSLAYVFKSVVLFAAAPVLFFYYPYLTEYRPDSLILLAIPLILSIVVGCYKTSGLSFAVILTAFLLFPLTQNVDYQEFLSHIVIDNTAMLGMSMAVICGVVFVFVLIGQLLVYFGIIDRLVKLIMNRVDSPARVAILSSAVFGSVSGSAVANVMSTGQVTIPLMIKCGYSKVRAAAYEAVASTGGQLMPPIMGAAAFLMAEILQISYWDVVLVAILPAIAFYAVLLLNVPKIKGGDTEIQNSNSVYPLLPAVTKAMSGLIILSAAIGLIIGVMDQTALNIRISSFIMDISGGRTIIILLLVAVLCIVLGMGMPTSSTYLIVAIIAAPTLIDVGITPIYAHLFVLYFGVISMITPPVALSSFTAAKISGANPMLVALNSMYIGWPLYILPFIFVWF